jgi:hypothetical protein
MESFPGKIGRTYIKQKASRFPERTFLNEASPAGMAATYSPFSQSKCGR